MEATECGATALGIVLEYLGSFVPLSTLREECGVSRDGSKASNIIKAARKYGLEAKGYRKEPEDVRQMAMPVIVHWNFNHFLVMEGFSKTHVFLNDPASGPRTVTHEEFDHAFTGVVLAVTPGPEFVPKGRRPWLLPSLLRRLVGSRGALAFVALAGVALVLPGLVVPVFSMVFVDEVLVGGKHEWLKPLLIGMAGAAVLRAALTALQRTYLVKLLMKLAVSMSSNFMWHALRLPVGFYFARSPGDLASRVHTNDEVAHLLSGRLSAVLLDVLLVAFYCVFMLYLDPVLTLIGIGTVALHLVLLQAAARGRTDLSRTVGQHAGKLVGVASGGLQMIETIKATGSENEFFGQWAGYQAKLVGAQQALARREQVIMTLTIALSRTNSLLVLSIGALRIINGHISVGTLVAFQSLMASFVSPVERLAQAGAALQQLRGNIERLDDVLGHERDEVVAIAERASRVASVPLRDLRDEDDAPESRMPPSDLLGRQVPSQDGIDLPRRLTGELELKGVTFGYLPFSPPLVEELDLHISAGQRVALVGGTGSGKSTIAKLVCGLYRPWEGQILFDGQERESLSRTALTSSIAMVDQDIALFEGTVRDNITLWDDTLPETDVVQAAKDACIHEDITRLQGGYDARVTEGGFNFSGGQRQRLELARALVRQPALVVLDEATSALDTETERQVDENLRRRGCSCLIVAHRLSTIRDSDEIIVLERGRVVQRGSHEELLPQEGTYRELITAV
jgi:NHLM bacteriocin system ABC transporter peptidase/ATP-binding protein